MQLSSFLPSAEAFENVALGILELALLIAAVALVRRRAPDMRSIAIVLAVLFVAHIVLFMRPIQALFPSAQLHWNWDGKALSIAVTLLAISVIPRVSWSDAGFRWKQNNGFLAAIAAAVVMCAFAWGMQLLIAGLKFSVPGAERLLYEATMPGLNEEPLYRGLALLLIDRAFWGEGRNLIGARIGWGAILTSLWFGLIHGVGLTHGRIAFDVNAVWIIAVIGFFLAWIRVRTGSLVVGVVAHNVVNVGSSLIG